MVENLQTTKTCKKIHVLQPYNGTERIATVLMLRVFFCYRRTIHSQEIDG